MSDRPKPPEQIGDAVARALDPAADAAKREIWRRVAGVLVGAFEPKAIDVLADPTDVEAYMPDGRWCWARTVAWQVDPDTGFPLALWLKVSDESLDWEKLWPAVAVSDHKFAIDSEDDAAGDADYAEIKIIVGVGGTVTPTTGSNGKALAVGVDFSDADPLPDAAEADPGNGTKAARWNHVHPLARPSKIRYYLSDTVGSGEYTGNLLLTENPYPLEVDAVDYVETNQSPPWAVFVSAPGSPGLAVWQGGVVHAHLRVKLINPQVGRTYKLYTGNGDIVYTSMIWDWTHSDTYQVKESAPAQPSVTTAYADLDFDLPVTALAAGADGRLGLNMRLRVFVGSDEAVFDNEKVVIRIGGDNASYLDTLFTPDGSFSGVHNDLDGRDVANCHPMDAITPGRILWNEGATVATVSGLLTMPEKSNAVRVSGTETLLGIATSRFTPGTVIYLESAVTRPVANGGTPGTGYYPLSFHVSLGMTASPSLFLWPANSGMVLKLTGGGNWLVLSAPWLEPQRALWPTMAYLTINTTDAPGLLVLPAGCPGTIYVTGTELRAITIEDADGNVQAGPLAAIKLVFENDCTLYHNDLMSGWDELLSERAAKLDLFPPAGATGASVNIEVPARRTYRLQRDVYNLLWIPEVSQ